MKRDTTVKSLTDVEKAERILKGTYCRECYRPFLPESANGNSLRKRNAYDPTVCGVCVWIAELEAKDENDRHFG